MTSLNNCEYNVRLHNIINEYPEEMLLKIFGFLDLKSIKKMILVNKRWYDILTNDINTMKMLPLTIRGDLFKMNHLIVGNSKFHKVNFVNINDSFNTEMQSKLKTIGANVHAIEFIDCLVFKPKELQDILRNFPKVEKLKFIKCSFKNTFQKIETEVLELENLKELEFEQRNLMMLSCIRAQLKSFKVDMTHSDGGTQELRNEQQLREFLYTQKRLETLELNIETFTSEVFAKVENAEYQFKLKKLSIGNLEYDPSYEAMKYENLKDFLLTQKDSVEILELGKEFSDDLYELILNKFENVRTLSIISADLPADLSFYKKIKVYKNVTKLILDGWNEGSDQYSSFLSLFPNVTDIRFTYYTYLEVLSYLPTCCKVLTSLSLNGLLPGNYQNLKFPALKNLHFECIKVGNGWTDLVMSNPTIESLSFKKISGQYYFNPYEIQMVCELLPNLKHLKLAGGMKDKLYHFANIKKSIKISLS